MRRALAAGLWLMIAAGTGCITIAEGRLPAIQPSAPSQPGTLEDTVGDFAFTLEGGKMITSNKAGRLLNDALLERWKQQGYIAKHESVPSGEFTGKADYNLTLSGSQYGESSIAMQILSGLTLFLIPHYIDSRFDVQYTIENPKTGAKYSAGVEDAYTQWSELFLLLALPWSGRGASATFDAMADHLYEQLRAQGAFAP